MKNSKSFDIKARERQRRFTERHREEEKARLHAYYEAHKEEFKDRAKKWAKSNPEKRKEIRHNYHQKYLDRELASSALWSEQYPERKSAHFRAQYTIPLKDKCELCGARATDRHHPDYSKPLDVIHLCKSCHGKQHSRRSA
jgi:hypothetical protein